MKLLFASGLAAVVLTGGVGAYALTSEEPAQAPPEAIEVIETIESELSETVLSETDAPEVVVPEAEVPETVEVEEEAAEEGEPASETGKVRRDAGKAFAAEMQTWAACVGEAAESHDESAGRFDPTAACDERPAPPVPDQARVPERGEHPTGPPAGDETTTHRGGGAPSWVPGGRG